MKIKTIVVASIVSLAVAGAAVAAEQKGMSGMDAKKDQKGMSGMAGMDAKKDMKGMGGMSGMDAKKDMKGMSGMDAKKK
jgi:hypothetical protein